MTACLRLHPTIAKSSRRRAKKAGHTVTLRLTWEQLCELRALAAARGEYPATTSAHGVVAFVKAGGGIKPPLGGSDPTPDALSWWLP